MSKKILKQNILKISLYLKMIKHLKFYYLSKLIQLYLQGTYEVDEKTQIINVVSKNNALNNVKKYFKYYFSNDTLNIEVHFGGEPTIYKLRKQ